METPDIAIIINVWRDAAAADIAGAARTAAATAAAVVAGTAAAIAAAVVVWKFHLNFFFFLKKYRYCDLNLSLIGRKGLVSDWKTSGRTRSKMISLLIGELVKL